MQLTDQEMVERADSRSIPLPVRRTLRQEAGFGCCACGHPFVEYHHIIAFHECECHNPAEMVALCPNHHHLADTGGATEGEVRSWKAQPHNVAQGCAGGQIHTPSAVLAVQVGANLMVGLGFKIMVDDHPLLQLRAGDHEQLLLSLEVAGLAGDPSLVVVDNEWITGSPPPWDLEYAYNRAVVRHASRSIALDVDARGEIVTLRGALRHAGQEFRLSPNGLLINGAVTNVWFSGLGMVSMRLVVNTKEQVVQLHPDPAFGVGKLVTAGPNRTLLDASLGEFRRQLDSLGRNDGCPCGSGMKWKKCCGPRVRWASS